MDEKIIELGSDSFESCLAFDIANEQTVIFNKAGKSFAEFLLKPLSQGQLIEIQEGQNLNLLKGLSLSIQKFRMKQPDDSWLEGEKMTLDELKGLIPKIVTELTGILLRMTYLLPSEVKNSETLSSGSG